MVDELLRNKCDEISIRVVFGENCCNNSLNISSFLIFDSANKFKEVLKKRRKRGRHRIYSKWIPDRQRQLSEKRKRKIDRTRREFHVHTEEVSPESVYDDQQIQEKHDEVGKLKLLPEEIRKHSQVPDECCCAISAHTRHHQRHHRHFIEAQQLWRLEEDF